MKILLSSTLIKIFFLTSFGFNAQAQNNSWVGIWQKESCSASSSTIVSNGGTAIFFDHQLGDYTVAIGDARFSDRLALISSEGANVAIPTSGFEKCEEAAPELQVAFGEAITVFLAFSEVQNICLRDRHSTDCLEAAFGLFDVTGNDALSRAEISRGVRVVGFFGAYMASRAFAEANSGQSVLQVNAAEISGSALVANIVSPVLAQNLLASYDFDDDGSLSLVEILTDRATVGPLELTKLIGDASIQEMFEFGAKWILNMTGSLGSGLFGFR